MQTEFDDVRSLNKVACAGGGGGGGGGQRSEIWLRIDFFTLITYF